MKKVILFFLLLIMLVPAFPALAQPSVTSGSSCTPGSYTVGLCDPLGLTKGGTFQQAINKTFLALGTVVALLAIVMIVYSGLKMLISRGEPDALKTAKSGFTYAIIGFVISAASFVVVLAFQKFIGVDPSLVPATGQTLVSPLTSPDAVSFIKTVLTNTLAVMGFLASVMIVFSAYLYATSGGNDEQNKKAKNGILWSIVGLLTSILAYVIITAVINLF